MKKIIENVLKNNRAIIFSVIILFIIGIISLITLPQSVFPKVVFPQIIITANRGFAPLSEMESNVVKPLENTMQMVEGVNYITSKTRRGSAELTVNLNWNIDLNQAYQSVLSKVAQVKSTLPAGTEVLVVRMTTSTYPVSGYSLYSNVFSPRAMTRIVLSTIKPALESVEGVDAVEVIGARGPEFRVELKPEKLLQYHLDPGKIIDSINNSNRVEFLGTVTEEYKLFLGFTDLSLSSVSDLENLMVGENGGFPIFLKQVAEIKDTTTEIDRIGATDGHPAVLFNIIKHPDANVLSVSKNVDLRLAQIQKHLQKGISISKWYDLSEFVKKSVNGIAVSILTGILIISAIVFLFLKNIRNALPIIIIMPLAITISFALLKILGFTINIMTLGGLTAAIGILVDNASLVVENVVRHREGGKARKPAVIDGTSEVAVPMISATLTTVAVFIPLVMLSGISGFFFKASSATLAIALLISLILAIFVTPILVYGIVGDRKTKRKSEKNSPGILQRGYAALLGFSLKHSIFALAVAVILVGSSAFVYTKLETGFLPTWDEGTFIMDLDTAPGTSIAEMSRIVDGVEKVIGSVPEISTYSRQTGDEAVRPNEAHFFIHPSPLPGNKSISVFKVMDKLEEELIKTFPDLNVDLHQILPDRFNDFVGKQDSIVLKVFGDTPADIQTVMNTVTPGLEKIPLVKKVKAKDPDMQSIFYVKFNDYKLAKLKISAADASAQLKTILWGTEAAEISQNNQLVKVKVTYSETYSKYLEDLRNAPLFSSDGKSFPLSNVAEIIRADVPVILRHENGTLVLPVDITTNTPDLRASVQAIQQVIDNATLPAGARIDIGGDWKNQTDSFNQLVFILSLSAVLVFTLLLFEFKSYRISMIIFIGTLFSLSFVILGLALSNTPFNVSTFMGLITSLGIVVNNGIFIIDFAEKQRKRGSSVVESIKYAGMVRVRPVLLTSITTIAGFLPLALQLGGGGEMLQPFAVAIISGLIGSLFFSLLIIPNMYKLFISDKEKI